MTKNEERFQQWLDSGPPKTSPPKPDPGAPVRPSWKPPEPDPPFEPPPWLTKAQWLWTAALLFGPLALALGAEPLTRWSDVGWALYLWLSIQLLLVVFRVWKLQGDDV